jgi:tetratricopeptide (TPR) repeat protein
MKKIVLSAPGVLAVIAIAAAAFVHPQLTQRQVAAQPIDRVEVCRQLLAAALRDSALAPKNISSILYGDIAAAQARLIDVDAMAQSLSRVDPTSATSSDAYCTLARAQIVQGDNAAALQSLLKAKDCAARIRFTFQRELALRRIAACQTDAGDTAEASQTLAQAKALALPLGNDTQISDSLQQIAILQAQAGDTDGAAATADSIPNPDPRDTTRAYLTEVRTDGADLAGLTSAGLWVSQHRVDPTARIVLFADDAMGQARMLMDYGNYKRAVELLLKAQKLVATDPRPNHANQFGFFTTLARAQIGAKDDAGAIQTIGQAMSTLPATPSEADFNNRIAAANLLVDAGDKAGALQILSQIQSQMDPHQLSYVGTPAIITWAKCAASAGDTTAASNIANTFLSSAGDKVQAYAAIAPIQFAAGDSDGAQHSLDAANASLANITQNGLHDLCVIAIAQAQAACGDDQSATATLDLVSAPRFRERGAFPIALALAKCGKPDKAILEIENSQKDPMQRAKQLVNLANSLQEQ